MDLVWNSDPQHHTEVWSDWSEWPPSHDPHMTILGNEMLCYPGYTGTERGQIDSFYCFIEDIIKLEELESDRDANLVKTSGRTGCG